MEDDCFPVSDVIIHPDGHTTDVWAASLNAFRDLNTDNKKPCEIRERKRFENTATANGWVWLQARNAFICFVAVACTGKHIHCVPSLFGGIEFGAEPGTSRAPHCTPILLHLQETGLSIELWVERYISVLTFPLCSNT